MLTISRTVTLPESEIRINPIRAQGPGGQNVNNVSCAVHLRFDIRSSSLPDDYKERLLGLTDHRINRDGVVVLKAQEYRSLEQNREAALSRLRELIRSVAQTPMKRRATKPTRASQKRRLDSKKKHGRTKALRGSVEE